MLSVSRIGRLLTFLSVPAVGRDRIRVSRCRCYLYVDRATRKGEEVGDGDQRLSIPTKMLIFSLRYRILVGVTLVGELDLNLKLHNIGGLVYYIVCVHLRSSVRIICYSVSCGNKLSLNEKFCVIGLNEKFCEFRK